MKKRGVFITFEGTDGVGKTTQIALAEEWLFREGHRVVRTREPGGGPVSERLRALILDPLCPMEPMTELFLYQAARIEHVEKIVRPALERGDVVLCDRFTDATLAYQGAARGLPNRVIQNLSRLATGGLKPDLTLWLDRPAAKALRQARAKSASKKGDRIEMEGAAFQERVRRGYAAISRREPRRFRRVVVRNEIVDTQAEIRRLIGARLSR